MGARASKIVLTVEQAAYVKALVPLLKAVREYPYVNRKTPLFFDACDSFFEAIKRRRPIEEIRHWAKMVDFAFHKWQKDAFGCAIIPAKYHMLHRADYVWPAVPTGPVARL
jgi:hypothetical protein